MSFQFQRYVDFRVLDIESQPLPEDEALRFAPEFEPDGRLKDPVKIEEDVARKRTEWLQDCALRPQTGKVAAIGLLSDSGAITTHVRFPEEELLYWFWNDVLNSDPNTYYLTFFGNGFDIPFLIRRSWKLGVGFPSWVIDDVGNISRRFVDIARIWRCGNYQDRISLKHLSLHLNVGDKDDGKSAAFYSLSMEEATEHLRNDLILTARCAHKMGLLHPHAGMLQIIWPGSTTVQPSPPLNAGETPAPKHSAP